MVKAKRCRQQSALIYLHGNGVEDHREKAISYDEKVKSQFETIRYHADKLEQIVDDNVWPLPKFRELLFLK